MPQEVRCILFDRRESYAAVGAYLSSRGQTVDAGMIQQLELEHHGDGLAAAVTIHNQRAARRIAMSAAEVLAAMLLFCSTRRIPLPHLAHKSVERADGNFVLVVTTALPDGRAEPDTVRLAHDDTARRLALGIIGKKLPSSAP